MRRAWWSIHQHCDDLPSTRTPVLSLNTPALTRHNPAVPVFLFESSTGVMAFDFTGSHGGDCVAPNAFTMVAQSADVMSTGSSSTLAARKLRRRLTSMVRLNARADMRAAYTCASLNVCC